MHDYPNAMLTPTQSSHALHVDAISPNETLLAPADTSYLLQDNAGRLIPVKQRKVKRASKADVKHGGGGGASLSASFHGGVRPRLLQADDDAPQLTAARSFRLVPERPHSLCADHLPDSFARYANLNTSTPAHKYATSGGRTNSAFCDSDGPVRSQYFGTSQSDHMLMPPPPMLPVSPRSSHVQTNGSLSYHQNMRRAQWQESESDSEPRPSYKRSLAFTSPHKQPTAGEPPRVSSSTEQRVHGSVSAAAVEGVAVARPEHNSMRSRSAVDFRKVALESSDSDALSQQHINAALAQSLCLSDSSSHSASVNTSRAQPAALASTSFVDGHRHNQQSLAQPVSYGFQSQKPVNIDRPKSKLASKRQQAGRQYDSPTSSLRHYDSPTSSLRTMSSVASNDTWSNTSALSPTKQQQVPPLTSLQLASCRCVLQKHQKQIVRNQNLLHVRILKTGAVLLCRIGI